MSRASVPQCWELKKWKEFLHLMSITWASVFPLHNDKTCSVYRVDKSQTWEVFSLSKEVKKKYYQCLFCMSLWACEVCVGRSFRAIFTRGRGQFSNAAVRNLRRSEWIYIAPSRLGLLCSFNAFCTHIKRHLSPCLTAWLRGVIRLNTLGTRCRVRVCYRESE